MAETFINAFLRANFVRMRGIDLGVKLFGIFVISLIYVYNFVIRITSSKECRPKLTQRVNYPIKDILSKLVATDKIDMVMRRQDFASLGFPAM